MNTTRPGTINTKAVLAIMAFTLVVAALFGSPTSSVPSVPDVGSQVAGR
jgi:hypothetical protein